MTLDKLPRTRKIVEKIQETLAIHELTAAQVSAMLSVSAVTLGEYIEKKGLPVLRGGDGKKGVARIFDSRAVLLWAKLGKKDNDSDTEQSEVKKLKAEQERYKLLVLQEKYAAAKMANETLSGKLYPADVVDLTWIAITDKATKTMRSIAPRIEYALREIEDSNARVVAVQEQLDSVRVTMSEMTYEFDMDFYEDLLEKNTDDESATEI